VQASSDLDIGLPDNCDDSQYLGTLADTLTSLWDSVRPALVLYNAGERPVSFTLLQVQGAWRGPRVEVCGRHNIRQDNLLQVAQAGGDCVAGDASSRKDQFGCNEGGVIPGSVLLQMATSVEGSGSAGRAC
jgi:hypothetical protein